MVDLILIAIHSKEHQECQVANHFLLRNSAGGTNLGTVDFECEESVFIEQLGCVVETIQSFRFSGSKCPVEALQIQLQSEGLEIDIIRDNPILFNIFKQKVYNEFRYTLQPYIPFLTLVDI